MAAFERRLHAAARARRPPGARHGTWAGARTIGSTGAAAQLSVIDIHDLHDRAKRFVVGAVLKRMFEDKESLGTARPLVFVVLDELNKYAPREGIGPIKEVLLDISERGRSLGIILIGAAADGERGRRPHRGQRRAAGGGPARHRRGGAARVRLPDRGRAAARAGILKPGTMIVQQPEIPTPLLVRFPFPAWATRKSEVAQREPDRGRGLHSGFTRRWRLS